MRFESPVARCASGGGAATFCATYSAVFFQAARHPSQCPAVNGRAVPGEMQGSRTRFHVAQLLTREPQRMNRLLAIGLLAVLPVTALANPVWKGDFETGNLSQWDGTQMVDSDRLAGRHFAGAGGEYALKATVKQGDNPIGASGNRNELFSGRAARGHPSTTTAGARCSRRTTPASTRGRSSPSGTRTLLRPPAGGVRRQRRGDRARPARARPCGARRWCAACGTTSSST